MEDIPFDDGCDTFHSAAVVELRAPCGRDYKTKYACRLCCGGGGGSGGGGGDGGSNRDGEPFFYMNRNMMRSHLEDPDHLQRARDHLEEREGHLRRFFAAYQLRLKIRKCGSPEPVRDLLYRYAFEGEEVLSKARRLYQKYEKYEPVVLLELALWKSACILYDPHDNDIDGGDGDGIDGDGRHCDNNNGNKFTASTMMRSRDVLAFYDFISRGWKCNKVRMRRHPLIGSVIRNVLPFLDLPDPNPNSSSSPSSSSTIASSTSNAAGAMASAASSSSSSSTGRSQSQRGGRYNY